MKRTTWSARALSLVVAGLTVTGIAAAAANYGSKEDPLVTASYIEDVVRPEISEQIEDALDKKEQEILEAVEDLDFSGSTSAAVSDALIEEIAAKAAAKVSSGSAESWNVIKVPSGKTLTGKVGCQVMLRIGSASCVSSGSTGLIDVSDGSVLGPGGALKTNHLYMVTIDGRGVKASGDATLLVKGSYSIN